MQASQQHLSGFGCLTIFLVALVALTACAPAVREPAPALPAGELPNDFPVEDYQSQSLPSAGKVLRIDSTLSELRILVYRGGELARFGHNHVVTSTDIQGFVFRADDVVQSRFDFFLPVDRLSVDDPAVRAQEGADFSSTVSAKDSQATRANMLGDKVLYAAQFPFLQISGKVAGVSQSELTLDIDINMRGVSRSVQTVATISERSDGLAVEGSLEVRQSDFAIEPFSALLGRLLVLDEVTINYRFVATDTGS